MLVYSTLSSHLSDHYQQRPTYLHTEWSHHDNIVYERTSRGNIVIYPITVVLAEGKTKRSRRKRKCYSKVNCPRVPILMVHSLINKFYKARQVPITVEELHAPVVLQHVYNIPPAILKVRSSFN